MRGFNEYQKRANKTAIYDQGNHDRRKAAFLYPVAKLAGEAGEVAEKVAKLVRDKGVSDWNAISAEDQWAIAKELGDVCWYISHIALLLGFDYSTIHNLNLEKVEGRAARGTIQGSGDDR